MNSNGSAAPLKSIQSAGITLTTVASSNANGRAFEFLVVQQLLEAGVAAGGKTDSSQRRDSRHVSALAPKVRQAFDQAAPKVVRWARSQLGTLADMEVRRLDDNSGSVADFVLLHNNHEVLRVSLKYNHDALKHPRPYSFAQACGIAKGSSRDISHRAVLDVAVAPLRTAAMRTRRYLFREHHAETRQCYDQVVHACAASLANWSTVSSIPAKIFAFLVGTDYHKVILRPSAPIVVEVQDFRSLEIPTSMAAEACGAYLKVRFDNGWEIHLRIHNAASRIPVSGSNQLPLKFDAQRVRGTVPLTYI